VIGVKVGGSGRTGARAVVLGLGLGIASCRRGWRGVSGSWMGESRLGMTVAGPEGAVFGFDDGPLRNLSNRSSARDAASSGSRVRLRGEERIGVQASRGLIFVVDDVEEELRLAALVMAWRRSSCRLLLSTASVAASIASPGGEESRVDDDGFVEEDEELRLRTLFTTSFMKSDDRLVGRDEDDKDDDDDDEGVAVVVFMFRDAESTVDMVLSMASMSSFDKTTEDWRRGV